MIRAPEIISADNGFAIVRGADRDVVRFDEVRAIIAWKRDELTSDLVCCDINTDSRDGEQVRTVHEELAGFEALMTRFAVLPGFDRHSWEAVIGPAFAADRRIIYTRGPT
jgi:hypothetical protein